MTTASNIAMIMADGQKENNENNDVLCYIQNCFYNHPKVVVGNNVTVLFRDEEIDVAKVWLYNFVDNLSTRPDGIPRRIRRQGENKKKQDCEDLLALYTALDNAKIELPLFTAANIKRLMPLAAGELDICTIAAMMSDMQLQLSNITAKLNNIEAHVTGNLNSMSSAIQSVHEEVRQAFGSVSVCLDSIDTHLNDRSLLKHTATVETAELDTETAKCLSESLSQKVKSPSVPGPSNASSSWADMAGGDWIPVTATRKVVKPVTKPVRSPRPVKVTGTRTGNVDSEPIKAVPRKNIVAAFVGRMNKDTKEEDLKSYLEDAGIRDIICHKLKPKEGYKFTTSAFFVSCNAECRDIFWNCSIWPEGAELRDWVFRS